MGVKYSTRVVSFLLGLAAVALAAAPAAANQPPNKPMLRIEAGMHTAPLKQMATDASGRYVVTVARDKTARVWDGRNGRLLKILRPPLDNSQDGRLFAVAMSPDAREVACAGWTGFGWDRKVCIYIMDRSSGRMLRRLTGLPNVVHRMAWSPSGRHLAVGLGGKNGVRIYNAKSWYLAGEDKNYQGSCYGVAFDRNDRLASTCEDGYVRLYNTSYKLQAKYKVPGKLDPMGVAFTYDGARVAVGYHNSTQVDVLSGHDLHRLYSADTSKANGGSMSSVAWSRDGVRLYAAGRHQENGFRPIYCWGQQGRGPSTKLLKAQQTVMYLLGMPDGGVGVVTADPGWGLFDRRGKLRLWHGPPTADFRDAKKLFRISHDGTQVEFGYKVWGKDLAHFDLRQNRITRISKNGADMAPRRTEGPGIKVTGWKNTYDPKLNGNLLKLNNFELARSVDIMPDNSGLVLGSSWHLRYYDRHGKKKWQVPAPGTVWAVKIAGNGQVFAAGMGDGTIRWYRVSDGQELLALFPHHDQRRWVIWTPSGYYNASAGGEDLIGWHVNRGKDHAADFFGASRMRSAFYRPGVVQNILATRDEARALAQANTDSNRRQEDASARRQLPPVVSILSPADGSPIRSREITLRYDLRAPSGEPITDIKVLVDGRPLSAQRGLSVRPGQGQGRSMTIMVPPRDVAVSLIAANRHSASEPSTVRLRWRGRQEKPQEFIVKPKLYVLSIGVSKYRDSSLDLEFAAKDAKDFARVLRHQRGKLYREVVVKELTDQGATRVGVLDGLEWIERQTTAHDVAMVLLAGHGVNDQDGVYYFVPSDARVNRLRMTGVPFNEIKRTVANLSGKTLFFIDTCHSGNALGSKRRGVSDINAVVNELASAENGAVVFTSATGRQYALENRSWGNGAFTKAVVEGLSGKADYRRQGKVTINMLNLYISERVKELTGGRQTPTSARPNTVSDFPIALVE